MAQPPKLYLIVRATADGPWPFWTGPYLTLQEATRIKALGHSQDAIIVETVPAGLEDLARRVLDVGTSCEHSQPCPRSCDHQDALIDLEVALR